MPSAAREAARDTSGIRDSVVKQLLAKLDGVAQLDNVLVVGMTNQQKLIDDALLRSGRLEVRPLSCPTARTAGDSQHPRCHLLERGCLDDLSAAAIGSGALAAATPAYSGADLAGLLRSAASFALERYVDAAVPRGWEVSGGKRSGKARSPAPASPASAAAMATARRRRRSSR